jgi:hypothetical protein
MRNDGHFGQLQKDLHIWLERVTSHDVLSLFLKNSSNSD